MHNTFLMSFSDKRDDRWTAVQRYNGTSVHRYNTTYIYPPLDKRYSPITSSICGPNNSNYKFTIITGHVPLFFLSFRRAPSLGEFFFGSSKRR